MSGPGGLGSSSGGWSNIMDITITWVAAGRWKGTKTNMVWEEANGIYIVRFANLPGTKRDYLRALATRGLRAEGWQRSVAETRVSVRV